MANLILFILATIGLTNILVHGKVLDEIKLLGRTAREWMHSLNFTKELLSCYECTGWWSGLMTGTVVTLCTGQSWLWLFLCPWAGSVVSSFYSEIVFLIRSKTEFMVEEDGKET